MIASYAIAGGGFTAKSKENWTWAVKIIRKDEIISV